MVALFSTLELEKDTVISSTPSVHISHCGYNLVWTARPTLPRKKLCPLSDRFHIRFKAAGSST